MVFSWPAEITSDDGGFHIEFPDVPGAHSWGATREEAQARGEDALVSILAAMIDAGEEIPAASPARGRPMAALSILDAAKLSLYQEMRLQQVSNVQLGVRVKMDEKAVRRMLDLGHRSHIETIEAALQELGVRVQLYVPPRAPVRRRIAEKNPVGAAVPMRRRAARATG